MGPPLQEGVREALEVRCIDHRNSPGVQLRQVKLREGWTDIQVGRGIFHTIRRQCGGLQADHHEPRFWHRPREFDKYPRILVTRRTSDPEEDVALTTRYRSRRFANAGDLDEAASALSGRQLVIGLDDDRV